MKRRFAVIVCVILISAGTSASVAGCKTFVGNSEKSDAGEAERQATGDNGTAEQQTSTPADQAAQPEILTGRPTGLERVTLLKVEQGPKSVELMPDGHHLFVNDLYGHALFIFNIDDYGLTKIIRVKDEPVEMDFSQGGKYAWVSLYNSSEVLVVDTELGQVVREVPAGQVPKEVQVSPDGNWVYVSNWDSNTVTVIDAHTYDIVKTIPVYGTPRGIVFSPDGARAYICIMGGNTLTKVNVAAGHVIVNQIPCGENPRHAVITEDGSTIYVSNNIPGTVTRIDRASETITGVATVGYQARTIALTPDEAYLFVCVYGTEQIACVATDSMTTLFKISASKPIGMTVSPTGDRIFLSNYSPPQITVYHILR